MTVTVYSKPHCTQCEATRRLLKRYGIGHVIVDVTADPAARAYVQDLGYRQAPVVVAGTDHWSGFRPDRLRELVMMAPLPPAA